FALLIAGARSASGFIRFDFCLCWRRLGFALALALPRLYLRVGRRGATIRLTGWRFSSGAFFAGIAGVRLCLVSVFSRVVLGAGLGFFALGLIRATFAARAGIVLLRTGFVFCIGLIGIRLAGRIGWFRHGGLFTRLPAGIGRR